MQRITCYALLAVVALVAPIGGQVQAPQPTIHEIATISGVAAKTALLMPNGRVVLYSEGEDSIFAYDLASKRSTLVTRGFDGELGISRAGDRIAYDHESTFLWSTPINPKTGAATGPAQRVTVRAGDEASFSPDGRFIAFEGFGGRTKNLLAVVPVTGGPERVLAEYENTIHNICWSADGKWIFVLLGRSTVERVAAAGGRSQELISVPGRVVGPLDGQIVFYRPDPRAESEGRMAWATTSGRRGEFRVPPGATASDWTGSNHTALRLTKIAGPSTAPTLTIYEVDMAPVVHADVKR